MQITVIGHSTVLIEMAGRRIVTDPYFGTWGNVAYARLSPPAMTRESVSDADLVLVSHNHWDHVDRRYLRLLPDATPALAPVWVEPIQWARWRTRLLRGANVTGARPWQRHTFGPLAVTAVPALHIAPTVGYVIEGEGQTMYFAGDTFYGRFMEQVGERFRIDVALMPVTTFRIPMTMGESGALRAVRALRPSTVLPIHLAVQPRQPLLRTGQSARGFLRRVREAGLEVEVVLLAEGERWTQ